MLKNILLIAFLSFSSCVATIASATNEQMNVEITKIINQLQAIKPLIRKARVEQDPDARYQVHFADWTDSSGIHHFGLKHDLDGIQSSLISVINKNVNDPSSVEKIKNDFIGN